MSAHRLAALWRNVLDDPTLSAGQRRWLADEGSLTTRLRACCQDFSVEVLRQNLGRPLRDEAALLGRPPHQLAWLREVLLKTDGVPQVFAHSALARHEARGPWQLFVGMGNRPLGAALFSDPGIDRQPLQFRRLDARHPLYRAALQAAGSFLSPVPPPHLWARRSLFTHDQQSLLVCEVFLPTVFSLSAHSAAG
jgi:chorismate--pyruvate lyase